MRAAPSSEKYRRGQAWITLRIHAELPAWARFRNYQQFNRMSASAWAAKADAPVLTPFPGENDIPPRKAVRQAIAFNYLQPSPWRKM